MGAEADPTTYQVKLKDRHEVAESTMAFRFEKPTHFVFKPGQFIDMTLVDPPETDAEGNVRAFSIASALDEDTLMVATRMRHTAFKRVLRAMPLGTKVTLEGPSGNLMLHADAPRPAVLLAGGIGFTPLRSILLQTTKEKLPYGIVLLYSKRRPEYPAFLHELQALQRDNPRYTFVGTMTEAEKSHHPSQDERGLVNQRMLAKIMKNGAAQMYYLAGPPGMVSGLRTLLKEIGVTNEDIRGEEFSGY